MNTRSAWLLHAICSTEDSNKGAELEKIIGFADYTNHAVMTYSEFLKGLLGLLAVGVVIQTEKKLATSKEFKAWWKGLPKNRQIHVQKEISEIEEYLNEAFKISESRKEEKIEITESAFNEAVKKYRAAF